MPVKSYRPTTPTRRFQTVVSREEITKQTPEKSLVSGKNRTGGRSSTGRISSRFRGGGHKKSYREIDFKRDKTGIAAVVASIEYDPNRSARIALLHYVDGEKRYILAPAGLEVGRKILSGPTADILIGNSLPLKNIPAGAAGAAAAAFSVFVVCPLNVRVGANSPSLWPTMFSVTYTGMNFFPLCTAKV